MKKIGYIFLILFFIFFLSACFEENKKVTSVRVFNSNHELIIEFDSDSDLRKIEEIWKSMKEVKTDIKRTDLPFKIIMLTTNGSIHWDYNSDGYCMLLSKAKVPVYQIEKYKEFNQMINP
ncbi:hypothetical protein ACFL2O_09205 [Thermodesulfobacteriota bacterium]